MNLLKDFLEYKIHSKNLKIETITAYEQDIKKFELFAQKDFKDIIEIDILRYLEFLKKEYTTKTIFKKINILKNFFSYLLKEKKIEENPIENISIEENFKGKIKETKYLETGEIELILQECENNFDGLQDKMIIELILYSKMNIADILNLKISDLELFSYKYIFNKRKTIKIELDETIKKQLIEFVKIINDEKVNEKNDLLFYGITRQNFRARLIELGKKSKINKNVTSNMLKNTLKNSENNSIQDKQDEFFTELKKKYFEIGIGDK